MYTIEHERVSITVYIPKKITVLDFLFYVINERKVVSKIFLKEQYQQ